MAIEFNKSYVISRHGIPKMFEIFFGALLIGLAFAWDLSYFPLDQTVIEVCGVIGTVVACLLFFLCVLSVIPSPPPGKNQHAFLIGMCGIGLGACIVATALGVSNQGRNTGGGTRSDPSTAEDVFLCPDDGGLCMYDQRNIMSGLASAATACAIAYFVDIFLYVQEFRQKYYPTQEQQEEQRRLQQQQAGGLAFSDFATLQPADPDAPVVVPAGGPPPAPPPASTEYSSALFPQRT